VSADRVPVEARILVIPLNAGHRITVLYLTGNARVDAIIKERGFASYPIART